MHQVGQSFGFAERATFFCCWSLEAARTAGSMQPGAPSRSAACWDDKEEPVFPLVKASRNHTDVEHADGPLTEQRPHVFIPLDLDDFFRPRDEDAETRRTNTPDDFARNVDLPFAEENPPIALLLEPEGFESRFPSEEFPSEELPTAVEGPSFGLEFDIEDEAPPTERSPFLPPSSRRRPVDSADPNARVLEEADPGGFCGEARRRVG